MPIAAELPLPTVVFPAAGLEISRFEGERFLLQAFRLFAGAADSLERSYGMLRSEVTRLNQELERSNEGLRQSLEENRKMRLHLDRIVDALPCGVVVARADGAISLINPEGRRLLKSCAQASTKSIELGLQSLSELSSGAAGAFEHARGDAGEHELELTEEFGGGRWLAVRHAAMKEVADGEDSLSVFILRDVSEAKRHVQERDKLRREQALAEMSAVLAHEIRNPLGSLELFAGLLAGAGLSRECREWVEQVQVGLRTLGATVKNVLHFHSLPLPERGPIDLGQLLEWAGGFWFRWPGRRASKCACATGFREYGSRLTVIVWSRCC